MTLRRCDSLPTRLREVPIPAHNNTQPAVTHNKPLLSPDSPDSREQVIATWQSLHSDVKKIKNGLPPKKDPKDRVADKKEPITNNFAFTANNRIVRKKITYDNRQTVVRQEDDRCSSLPLDTGQVDAIERACKARRRTLLERLLSWRTCECPEREKPNQRKYRSEIQCTCGASKSNGSKLNNYGERGRSKSVGYETAREALQFRRCASAGASVGAETAAALRARAALTLARRYYPEGGWGWTITVVATIVQIIIHGLQLGGGTGPIACKAAIKYQVSPLYTHGE